VVHTAHADCLLLPLPAVTNVNNANWTDCVVIYILQPQIAENEIFGYYGTISKLYTSEKLKLITACMFDAFYVRK